VILLRSGEVKGQRIPASEAHWRTVYEPAGASPRSRRARSANHRRAASCVNDYVDWLDAHRKTGGDARYRVDTHVMPVLGDIQCDNLTTFQIQHWLRELANSPARLRTKAGAKKPNVRSLDKSHPEAVRRRRASANRTLVILKAALNSAWRTGKIHSDQAWRRVERFKEADAARVRYATVPEAKRLIDRSAPDFRPLVQAALVTGARYGELAALRVDDFNADSGTVHVRTSKSGKGRHVVLNDEGVAVFKSLVDGKSRETPLLTRSDGSAWTKSLQARPMRDACQRAEIKPVMSFHVLRHTWASLAVMAGVPLLVVARNLGHADTRMVEKHYGHLAPSYIVDAIRASGPTFGIETEGKSPAVNAAE
jgi:integrase